jgi:hypothetical protein
MREVITGIVLVCLFLIPGSVGSGLLWTGNRTGTGTRTTRTSGRTSRRQSRRFTWSSLARKHTVRNIWKSGQSICVSVWRLSRILPSRTVLVLVVSSLAVSSISDMAARSDIGYTDLWVREYGWRDPRPRTRWRILGNLSYFFGEGYCN